MNFELPAGSYLAVLVLSLIGVYLLDRRHQLAFTINPKRAILSLIPAYLVFLVWDVAGIALGIFFRGNNTLLSGLQLFPEFPIEELFFLALLCYSTLIAFRWITKLLRSK